MARIRHVGNGGGHARPPRVRSSGNNILVVNQDDMDDKTFVHHMEARHQDSLSGMFKISLTSTVATAPYLRAFHAALHRWRVDLRHDHE